MPTRELKRAPAGLLVLLVFLGACTGDLPPLTGPRVGMDSRLNPDGSQVPDASRVRDSDFGPNEAGFATDADAKVPSEATPDASAPVEHEALEGAGVVAPSAAWVDATGNLAGQRTECGTVSLVRAQPRGPNVLAGVSGGGMWATDDGGNTWSRLGQGVGSDQVINRPQTVLFDPEDPDIFWIAGIYRGGGVFRTTDGGHTFRQLGDISHNDSVGVDFTDPQRRTLLAGSHERRNLLYKSTDGGESWTNIGASFPDGSSGYCTAAHVIDEDSYIVGCSEDYQSSVGGIFRTDDGGAQWTKLSDEFVVQQALHTRSGNLLWVKSYGGVVRSTDASLGSFESVADGTISASVQPPSSLVELPDGRLVARGPTHLSISTDGVSWRAFGEPLPPDFANAFRGGVTYSASTKTFFVWRWTCDDVVPERLIIRAGFDYETM